MLAVSSQRNGSGRHKLVLSPGELGINESQPCIISSAEVLWVLRIHAIDIHGKIKMATLKNDVVIT
jgi:hypothetical protein